jgi:ABC-type sulfate transport system permease component
MRRMPILRGILRVVFIWLLSGLVAPYVRRGFARLARRAPSGSFLEATLIELSTGYTATFVNVVAELLTALIVESIDFLFMLAAALRLRPTGSAMAKR